MIDENSTKDARGKHTGVEKGSMPKLSEYVRMAADEYVREHGNVEPSARWVADFFHECGVQDEYPRQDLVAFAAMVQKELIKREEQAVKKTRLQLDKMIQQLKSPRKS